MNRVGVLIALVALLAGLMGWLDTSATPVAALPGTSDRGPEPVIMALGAFGLLAIGVAMRRRS